MSETSQRKPGWGTLAVILLVTLGGGAAVGLLTSGDMSVYGQLVKPSFAPPPWLFPVAWSLLYACMSVALWLVLRTDGAVIGTLAVYFVQLAVNFIWPVIFFVQKAYGLAFWWLALLWMLVIWLIIRVFPTSKAAGWLLVPYAAWVTFAGVLNFFIAKMNP